MSPGEQSLDLAVESRYRQIALVLQNSGTR